MSVTAKELARRLGISAAAVSMALNDKPGVSTDTRKKVKVAAEKYGYDFSKIKRPDKKEGTLLFVIYKKSGAVVDDTPFFSQLSEGIAKTCSDSGYKLKISYLYESDITMDTLQEIQYSEVDGILLLGTEMTPHDLKPFLSLKKPLVLLDSYFEQVSCDTILINNIQGAYLGTSHLIHRYKTQPGYLKSSYSINNFNERSDGFYKAIRTHGMSTSKSIVHELAPSMDGAYADMLEILGRKEPVARCYFADNDLIAAGARKAFREAGFRIPEDIAVVGFDNLPVSRILDLSTIHVPKEYMGEQACLRLMQRIEHPDMPFIKLEISTHLIERYSS